MSALRDTAEDYLAIRRACGYAMRQEGRMLASYLDHLERADATRVTVATALAWATEPSQADPSWWAKRLTVVRGFARYLATIDDDSEVPPDGLLPHHSRRRTPYLYSPAQIAELMAAAGRLAHPLRAATFATVIGLMACTGLRTGEAMRLDRDDVDLDDNLLTVRNSKHGKSRLVPLHPSTSTELRGYAGRRDELCPHPASPAFFLSGAGTRLNHTNASSTFAGLRAAAGITAPPRRRPARLTDLRHSFAVATLVTWYADGAERGRVWAPLDRREASGSGGDGAGPSSRRPVDHPCINHVTSEMTLRYAALASPTLRAAYDEAMAKVRKTIPVAVAGRLQVPAKVDWIASEFLKTRVAHGDCSRHFAAGACPYSNICEACDNYTPAPEFVPALRDQLADIQQLRADAQQRGWDSEVQRHRRVIEALDSHLQRPENATTFGGIS